MRTLNLSGFNTGDNLTLSISQGALTAGPINVPSWGGGGSGGTITINVGRSILQCAPDSVRFSVDLGASTFETTGPTGSEIYDARMHDLIYLWDFDDPGTWTAPENVLPAWKNRNVAKGPFVAHMYTQPGTYNPSVLVIEPSSGKTATASVEVIVANPDTVYAGTNTICVNPIGDADFNGAPTGAKQINVDSLLTTSPEWTAEYGGSAKRWLFKRGASFTLGVLLVGDPVAGVTFGAYGSGNRPVLSTPLNDINSNRCIYVEPEYGGLETVQDLRIFGLKFQGNYDPTIQGPYTTNQTITSKNAIRSDKSIELVVSDCYSAGMSRSNYGLYPNYTNPSAHRSNYHIDGCVITDFGGQYPVFMAPMTHPESSFSMTGTRLVQNPDAVDDPLIRAPIRINHASFIHLRGNDIFHTDRTQPCLKLLETPEGDGAIVNVHSCSLEAGLYPLGFGGNSSEGLGRSSAHNVIIDGLVIVGNYGTQSLTRSCISGVTLRNTIMIQPEGKKFSTRMVAFFAVAPLGSFQSNVADAPIRVYNNTMRIDRDESPAQNNGSATILYVESPGSFTAISETNNILHMPNMNTPSVAFAPLSETPLWTPRCKGYRDPLTLVLDTSYATPSGAVKDTKPLPGSAALGAALTGNVSYMDILGTTRSAPADKGAWEVE